MEIVDGVAREFEAIARNKTLLILVKLTQKAFNIGVDFIYYFSTLVLRITL
jgi:hypothetical protein